MVDNFKIRPASTRGIYNAGWIVSRRSFSNNSYYHPDYMNRGNLKVINDDVQQPGNKVKWHEHKNLDILGYLVAGELQHVDSTGKVINAKRGQIQHMWCGKSIYHTEASIGTEPARYLQIWITPKKQYINSIPYYECVDKSLEFGPIPIELHQDIHIQAGILTSSVYSEKSYLYVVEGQCGLGDTILNEGDAAEIESAVINPVENAHILLFENLF
jgi:quercetin 2,3-dioxygenase